MANGNNTAYAGNGTQSTFADDPSGAKRAEAARKRREREEADRLAKQEEQRKAAAAEALRVQQQTTQEQAAETPEEAAARKAADAKAIEDANARRAAADQRRADAEAWWNRSGGLLNDSVLTNDDRTNARYIADNTGYQAADDWVRNTINARRQAQGAQATAPAAEPAKQEINPDYVEGLRSAGYSQQQIDQATALWNENNNIDEVTALVESFVTPAQEKEKKEQQYTDFRNDMWNRYVAAGGSSEEEFNQIAYSGEKEAGYDNWVNVDALKGWVANKEGAFTIAENERKAEEGRRYKAYQAFLPKIEELNTTSYGPTGENYLNEPLTLTGEQTNALMEAYFAGGDEGFEAWLAENVPVVETATDPKDVNNIRGGVHTRGDVLKDDAGNPILDTNGEQVRIYRTGDGQGYYNDGERISWIGLTGEAADDTVVTGDPTGESDADRDARLAAEEAEKQAAFDERINEFVKSHGLTDEQIAQIREEAIGTDKPWDIVNSWVQREGLLPVGEDVDPTLTSELTTSEQVASTADGNIVTEVMEGDASEDVESQISILDEEVDPDQEDQNAIDKHMEPDADGNVDYPDPNVAIEEAAIQGDEDEVTEPSTPDEVMSDEQAQADTERWTSLDTSSIKSYRTQGFNDDQISKINQFIEENGNVPELASFIQGLQRDDEETKDRATPKQRRNHETGEMEDIDPNSGLTASETSRLEEAYAAGGLVDFLQMVDDINDSVEDYFEGMEESDIFKHLMDVEFDDEELTAAIRAGINYGGRGIMRGMINVDDLGLQTPSPDVLSAATHDPSILLETDEATNFRSGFQTMMGRDPTDEELITLLNGEDLEVDIEVRGREDPYDKTIRQLETTMQDLIGKMGYDSKEELALRRAGVDQDIDEAMERMTRQGLITPGATGEYDRAVIEMEKERVRQYRTIAIEVNQKLVEVDQQNFAAFTDAITKLGDLNLNEYMFTGDLANKQKQFDQEFTLRQRELESAQEQFKAGLISQQELQKAEINFKKQQLIQEQLQWSTDFQQSNKEFEAEIQLRQDELDQAQSQFAANLRQRDQELAQAQDQFEDAQEENARQFDEGTRRFNEELEQAQEQFAAGLLSQQGLQEAQLQHQEDMANAQLRFDRVQLADNVRLQEAEINFKNATLQNEKDLQDTEILFKKTELRQRKLEWMNQNYLAVNEYADRKAQWNDAHALDREKLAETGRQFDDELERRATEWGEKFGLDKQQQAVLKEEIRSRILNSTRELSLKTAETMAAITGVTGLGKGTLTFEDLGVPPASNEVIAMAEQNPDVILFSPEADLARESFIGLMGRDATDDEILKLMKGELVEVDNMPTLESRHLASTMMQQNMERVAKYGAIAEENGLDRDKFDRAKVESDRNWNRMTINYAAEFELDPNDFRMAIHDRDNMRLRGRDDNEIDRIMRSRWGDDYGTFLRAADNFDRDFGNQQVQLAMSMDMETERFRKGMEQADTHEMRVEDTWNAITEGKATRDVTFQQMNTEFPDVQRSFVRAFKNLKFDASLCPMEISSQLANDPALAEARQYLEDSQGKINDGAWRSFVGSMYESFQTNYKYTDPDTDIAFEFVDPPGFGRPAHDYFSQDGPSAAAGYMQGYVKLGQGIGFNVDDRNALEFSKTYGDYGTRKESTVRQRANEAYDKSVYYSGEKGHDYRDKRYIAIFSGRGEIENKKFNHEHGDVASALMGQLARFAEAKGGVRNAFNSLTEADLDRLQGWSMHRDEEKNVDVRTYLELEDHSKSDREYANYEGHAGLQMFGYLHEIAEGRLELIDSQGKAINLEERGLSLVPPPRKDVFETVFGGVFAEQGNEYKGRSTLEQTFKDAEGKIIKNTGLKRNVGKMLFVRDLINGGSFEGDFTFEDEFGAQQVIRARIPARPTDVEPADYRQNEFQSQFGTALDEVFDSKKWSTSQIRAIRDASQAWRDENPDAPIIASSTGRLHGVDFTPIVESIARTGKFTFLAPGMDKTTGFNLSISADDLAQAFPDDPGWFQDNQAVDRMSGGWQLHQGTDGTGDGVNLEYVNQQWLTDMIAEQPDTVQSLFALLNGGNFSPERTSWRPQEAQQPQQQQGPSGMAVLGQIAGAVLPALIASDREVKENIELIGQSPSGLNIYTFTYKKDLGLPEGVYQGVMSDEIPSKAVFKVAGEFDRVFYDVIDVDFKKVG